MSDTILIEDLDVECLIGIFDWEREVPQTVRISLALPANARAGQTDRIEDAVDYKKIAKAVASLVADSRFQLLETLAESIARMILNDFKLAWVELRIDKPGALRGARLVGLKIRREATDAAR